jgi:succinate-acetate transporter protein
MTTQKLANPGPLGLLGFGMTTILLNVHNAGYLPLSIMIIAMGVAMGGLAQLIAGIFEMKQGCRYSVHRVWLLLVVFGHHLDHGSCRFGCR